MAIDRDAAKTALQEYAGLESAQAEACLPQLVLLLSGKLSNCLPETPQCRRRWRTPGLFASATSLKALAEP